MTERPLPQQSEESHELSAHSVVQSELQEAMKLARLGVGIRFMDAVREQIVKYFVDNPELVEQFQQQALQAAQEQPYTPAEVRARLAQGQSAALNTELIAGLPMSVKIFSDLNTLPTLGPRESMEDELQEQEEEEARGEEEEFPYGQPGAGEGVGENEPPVDIFSKYALRPPANGGPTRAELMAKNRHFSREKIDKLMRYRMAPINLDPASRPTQEYIENFHEVWTAPNGENIELNGQPGLVAWHILHASRDRYLTADQLIWLTTTFKFDNGVDYAMIKDHIYRKVNAAKVKGYPVTSTIVEKIRHGLGRNAREIAGYFNSAEEPGPLPPLPLNAAQIHELTNIARLIDTVGNVNLDEVKSRQARLVAAYERLDFRDRINTLKDALRQLKQYLSQLPPGYRSESIHGGEAIVQLIKQIQLGEQSALHNLFQTIESLQEK